MKTALAFIVGLVLGAAAIGSAQQQPQQPSLPQREPITIADLFQRLGSCEMNLTAEKKYEQQLVQRIAELETLVKSANERKNP